MPDKTLGEVLHEARIAGGEQRPRPWPPESWADRDPQLKALDEAMAGAVAAAVREQAGARLAEVRQAAVTFRSVRAGVLHPEAEALWHAVIQVIDKVPLGGQEQERSDEAASPVAAELDPPEGAEVAKAPDFMTDFIPGQLPLPGTEP